jgi:hypothetical protein
MSIHPNGFNNSINENDDDVNNVNTLLKNIGTVVAAIVPINAYSNDSIRSFFLFDFKISVSNVIGVTDDDNGDDDVVDDDDEYNDVVDDCNDVVVDDDDCNI